MTEPAPTREGLLAHVREWFEKDVEPDVEQARTDVAKGLAWAEANARNLSSIASTVANLAEAAFPGAAPEIQSLLAALKEAAAKASTDLDHFLTG